jgi:hypothetical protein
LADVGDEVRWHSGVGRAVEFKGGERLPWVNSTTVTDLEPSGEFPVTVVPPVPISDGPGVPLTALPSAALADSSALAAAA